MVSYANIYSGSLVRAGARSILQTIDFLRSLSLGEIVGGLLMRLLRKRFQIGFLAAPNLIACYLIVGILDPV
jgi:hypothetical protein